MQQYVVESCGRKKMCRSALPYCCLIFFPFQDNDAGGSCSSGLAILLVPPTPRGTGFSAGLRASAKIRYLTCGVCAHTPHVKYLIFAEARSPALKPVPLGVGGTSRIAKPELQEVPASLS